MDEFRPESPAMFCPSSSALLVVSLRSVSSSWFLVTSFGFNSKLKIRNSTLLILQQLPQHVLQNPSMPIVIQFRGCIDTADNLELRDLAVIAGRLDGEFLSQLESGRDASDIELLESRQTEELEVLAGLELQGHDSHADQITAVNALKALCNRRFDAEEPRSFGRPVAGRAGAVFFASDDD